MNQVLIQQYLNELSDLRRASGTGREGVVSEAFKDLLKEYAKSHDLIFIPQYELPRQDGNRRIVDGALVYDLRIPFGYWEAKDEEDDLDKEIAAKFRRGYVPSAHRSITPAERVSRGLLLEQIKLGHYVGV